MCHKLLQVYACGHNRTICTTPCPHAIAKGRCIPSDRGNAPDLSRSSSVVSSMASSSPVLPARRTDVQDLPSQRNREPQAHPSPLRAAVLGSQAQQQQQQGGGNAPAFRFMAPGTGPEAPGAGSGYTQSHSTSPVSMSPASPSPSQPSPTFSTTGTLIDAPISTYTPSSSTFFTPANPEVDDRSVARQHCVSFLSLHDPMANISTVP
ncbi:hypothetical protein BKA58DRAFT_24060 [Alternaria rosae]|uniref:uncharacterized protein n=1 Tax=Alternaria rosae TaxID=1187941 RepID=UPI001E8DC667|nr:uncharacterized protein BKA58DRAFT_24060 [Alternaria rosae]KAH6882736.1 hypothetical protein BKA58DRAFT_24060 [Alternaria rosae]